MNEFFSLQHHCVKLGLTGDQITQVWECLDVIRTKKENPFEIGYSLEIVQIAFEWNNQHTTDYSYLNQFL